MWSVCLLLAGRWAWSRVERRQTDARGRVAVVVPMSWPTAICQVAEDHPPAPRATHPTYSTSRPYYLEVSIMFPVILFATLVVILVVSASSPASHQSSWERTRGTRRPRLGESLAARREAAEMNYMDRFSSLTLKDARDELARLTALYDEAEKDEDPYERFIQIRNDLGSAVRYYEHCMERRVNYTAIAA
ncbi:hypothetical protein CYJ73_17325 [Gordonia terrae]|uniref:Uncharacterized protein n=2 Tax=Gordonia terrae TaxID=2055 RepID=A0A2I1R5K6_9ACTN|nr:hypothetical protein CYJ73_17325 [Gordonia terrae]